MIACASALFLCGFCWLAQAQPASSSWAEGQGARVPIPKGWSVNQRLADRGGPISMTNFGGAYARGGILPSLGAEIEIASFPNPENLADSIRKELRGVRHLSMQEASVGLDSGIRVSYRDSMGPQMEATTVVYYVPRGARLYKFFLTYRTNHPEGAALETSFEEEVRGAALR